MIKIGYKDKLIKNSIFKLQTFTQESPLKVQKKKKSLSFWHLMFDLFPWVLLIFSRTKNKMSSNSVKLRNYLIVSDPS